ncbi:MAG: methylamine utilization protein, partial [Pseudomonadota bacterium]
MLNPYANAAEVEVQVNDIAGASVENAVVYLEPKDKAAPSLKNQAAIAQKNKTFIPLVTVIQTGSSIIFPNKDSVRHHVYSFSPAKTFELKLYSGVPSTPVVFDKAGTVVLGCNIHDQMLAFVYIVDTPYFAKTDASGKVT